MKAKNFSLIGIGITLLCVLIGETFRLKGILLLDLWAPLFAGTWLTWKLYKKEIKQIPTLAIPAGLFVGMGIASLLLNSAEMSWAEFIDGFLYSVRWASLAIIGILTSLEKEKEKILGMVTGMTVLLAIAGFIQLKFVPDFTEYEILGWDPHKNRLLSTWFDPNFVGGWLAVMTPVTLQKFMDSKKWSWGLALGIIGLALLLTLSRSAYLGLITGVGLFALLRSRQLLVGLMILGVLATVGLSPVRDRVISLVDSILATFTESYTLTDPSARHRFGSWEEGWNLFVDSPIIGQGYNRYGLAALELGTLKDINIHAANGSDSSVLTVMATTGLLGFLPFITVYALILRWAWRDKELGLMTGILGLFVHSIFVNSLLFPLLMAPLWILIGSRLHSRGPIR